MSARYHSPSASMIGAKKAKSAPKLPRALPPANDAPEAIWPRKATTQRPMIAKVAGASLRPAAPIGLRTSVRWPAHSGQRIPTEVEVMQSGQIGRSQFEQATFVSRPGWR